jgi:predicted metal-binding protein
MNQLRTSKDSTYSGIQKRLRGETKHTLFICRQRNATHQHQINLQEAHSTSMWEQETNMIISEWADQRNQGRQQNQ